MTLAELSLRRPVTAVMFFVSMVVIGLIAAFRLPLEQFPEFNVPFLMVNVPYASSTPQEVERSLTRPVEEALATLPGIKSMNSQSRPEGANIFIEFSDWDRDVAVAASEARDRIDAIRSDLPDDLQRYFVFKFSPTDQPMIRVRFASNRDLRNEYELIEREVQRRIERVPGVAKVEITGASPNEVEVSIDPSGSAPTTSVSTSSPPSSLRSTSRCRRARSTRASAGCACSPWARSATCPSCATSSSTNRDSSFPTSPKCG